MLGMLMEAPSARRARSSRAREAGMVVEKRILNDNGVVLDSGVGVKERYTKKKKYADNEAKEGKLWKCVGGGTRVTLMWWCVLPTGVAAYFGLILITMESYGVGTTEKRVA